MNDEGRHYLSVPKVLGTIGLAMVFALAMMAVVNFFWSSPCGGRVFGQAAECITNAGDIALDSLSSDAGSTITVTPTTDTIFSNGTGVVIGHTSQLTTGTRTSELLIAVYLILSFVWLVALFVTVGVIMVKNL